MSMATLLLSIMLLDEMPQRLQQPHHGQDDDEEDEGVGRAHLDAHGRIAVGQAHGQGARQRRMQHPGQVDRKSTRLNSSHLVISYAVFCLKKKKQPPTTMSTNMRPQDINIHR